MPTVEINHIYKSFGAVKAVDDVSFSVEKGEIFGLLGPNGAGKTTAIRVLLDIFKPDSGSVELNGENVNGIPSYERSQKGLIYLPQQHSVFMKTTVFNNLFMVLEMHSPVDEARQKAMDLLADFGLLEVKDSPAHQLSGGEKRRLEIARSMIMAPRFLFMDEPFTGIDPITILDIQTIILKLKARGIGIIITDHNVKDTFYITDLAYIIHKGHILSSGTPAQIVQEEKTRQLFLGKDFEWNG